MLQKIINSIFFARTLINALMAAFGAILKITIPMLVLEKMLHFSTPLFFRRIVQFLEFEATHCMNRQGYIFISLLILTFFLIKFLETYDTL